MCLYPQIHPNKKYTANKKNGGIIPPVFDKRVLYVPIGCGNCIECRKQNARAWQVRLMEDIKKHKNGKFITLTFSNESIKHLNDTIPLTYIDKRGKIQPLEGYKRDNEIATKGIRLFLERWRKKYGKSIRHWMVTEIGHKGTENIHLHGIMWTDNVKDITNIWKYGYVWDGHSKNGKQINYVNDRTVNYIIKYIHKRDEIHKTYKAKILTSSGIGKNYTENQGEWIKNKFNHTKENETKETYRTRTGHEINMPIYWRNKIYTDEEREALWLHKLDKKERWICGERVDISKGEENYYKLLKWYRRINREMGYGDYNKNWSRIEYENQRRNIMLKTRIENNNNKK